MLSNTRLLNFQYRLWKTVRRYLKPSELILERKYQLRTYHADEITVVKTGVRGR